MRRASSAGRISAARIARYSAAFAAIRLPGATVGRPRAGDGSGMSARSLIRPASATSRQSTALASASARSLPKVFASGRSGKVTRTQ